MAAAAGKKESVSLSLFLEADDLEVWGKLSTMATLFWAEGVCMGRWRREHQKACRKQFSESKDVETGETCRAVMCENRYVKWPQWQTFLLKGQVAVDVRLVCPQDVQKMPLKQTRMVYLKKWAAKHRCEEFKEGVPLSATDQISEGFRKMGRQAKNFEEGLEIAEEAITAHPLSGSHWEEQPPFPLSKWESETHRGRGMRVEGFRNRVGTDDSL